MKLRIIYSDGLLVHRSWMPRDKHWQQVMIMSSPTHTPQSRDLFPNGGWDTHHHIFEPSKFPYHADRHLTPPPATLRQFEDFKTRLGITHSVIAHGMSYGDDCASLKAFVPQLGSKNTRAIAIIDPQATPDIELLSMRDAGVRGLRVNLYRYNAMQDLPRQKKALLEHRDRLNRLALPWSLTMTTVRVDFWDDLAPFIESAFARNKNTIPIITDHFALLKAPSLLPPTVTSLTSQPGFAAVIRLLRQGLLYVKLSAPYRISDDVAHGYEDVRPLVRALVDANPERVLWGSDWPHTPRMRATPRTRDEALTETPFLEVDDEAWLQNLRRWLSDEEWDLLMVKNPERLFGGGECNGRYQSFI